MKMRNGKIAKLKKNINIINNRDVRKYEINSIINHYKYK